MRKEMRYVLEKGDKIVITENIKGSRLYIDEEYTIKEKCKGLHRYELMEKAPNGDALFVLPGQFKVKVGGELINPDEIIETIYITQTGQEYYVN